MKRYAMLFLLLLLCGCGPRVREESNNQFSLIDGYLYFSERFISNWANDIQLPVCKSCSKNVYSQYSPSGPMLFRQVNDENGDLVLLYATDVQNFFALNLGSVQYSVTLHINDDNLHLMIEQQIIPLQLNKKIKFKLGLQSYYALLSKLNFLNVEKQDLKLQKINYEADITIWIDAEDKG